MTRPPQRATATATAAGTGTAVATATARAATRRSGKGSNGRTVRADRRADGVAARTFFLVAPVDPPAPAGDDRGARILEPSGTVPCTRLFWSVWPWSWGPRAPRT